MAWNLESKTVLDSFTWGEQETEKEFLVMHSKIHSVCYMNTYASLRASSPGHFSLFPPPLACSTVK